MRCTETEGHLRHFYRFRVITDRRRCDPPLHAYTGLRKRKLALIPATQRVERPLHIAESEADQLCILGVYVKTYTLAGMPLCFGLLIFTSICKNQVMNIKAHYKIISTQKGHLLITNKRANL